jgi:hypothetical protein
MVLDAYFWTMVVLAFVMSFSIGSNETDALAMAYSSGAMNMFNCVSPYSFNLFNTECPYSFCSGASSNSLEHISVPSRSLTL